MGRIARLIDYFQTRSAMTAHIRKLEFERDIEIGKGKVLATKLAQAEANAEISETNAADLRVQLDNATQQIKELKEIRHESLRPTEVAIVELLDSQRFPMTEDAIQRRLKFGRAETQAAIAELKDRNLLFVHNGVGGLQYRLSDSGAKWLTNHKK